jgi:hypothetical protein
MESRFPGRAWNGSPFEHNIFPMKNEFVFQVTGMDIISLLGFLALVIIGIVIILLILRVIWMLLPAAIIAAIVFFLTINLWYAGVAFLVVAILTVLFKILR